ADTLATKGATEEELNRAREPELAKIRDAQRTNGYWAQNFVALHTNSKALDDMRSIISDAKAMKVEDINPLAAKYLKRDRATIGIANPKKKVADASASQPASQPAK
ncbi:MAG: hypothetical protein ACKVS6_06355, partial [Planctomycetota bacterium]